MVMSNLSALTRAAIDSYTESGEVAGLFALADALQEQQPPFWEEDAARIMNTRALDKLLHGAEVVFTPEDQSYMMLARAFH